MRPLKVLVVGRSGFIYTHEYKDVEEFDNYKFDLEITREMAPEASVVAFYVRDDDGEIIYDQFTLKLGFRSDNEV